MSNTQNPGREDGDELVRAIGVRALGLNVVNMVVGAGIFVLPGLVAVHLGSAAIIAYLICSVGVGLVFLCFAEVGTRVTRSGGAYAYIEEAFGPFAGFVGSILFWFGWSVLSDAAITVAMVNTLGVAIPVLVEPIPRAIFIIVLVAFLAIVNIRGVEAGVRLYVFNTVVKLVPLLVLLLVGLFAINVEYLKISEIPPLASIGAAALVLFFAFAGAESALSASGEIKNPTKTVPLGLFFGLIGILALYAGLQTVSQGVLGVELASNADAPLAAAANLVLGSWGGKMLIVAGVVSIYATVSGDMLNAPRVIYASARDGNLPRVLARVHPKFKTPHAAIMFLATIVCTFALIGRFETLALVASGSILLIYLGVSAAVIRLRHRDGLPKGGEFTLPFGPTIPILSMLVVSWLLFQLSTNEALAIAVLTGVAAAMYGMKLVLLHWVGSR